MLIGDFGYTNTRTFSSIEYGEIKNYFSQSVPLAQITCSFRNNLMEGCVSFLCLIPLYWEHMGFSTKIRYIIMYGTVRTFCVWAMA